MSASRLITTLAVLAVLAVAHGANAQSAPDADRHQANGEKLLRDGNTAGAIAELEAAYKDRPGAAPLLAIAAARKAERDFVRSADALEKALAIHGATMTADEKRAASSALGELRSFVGIVKIDVPDPPNAEVVVDGAARGASSNVPFALAPGTHRIGARAPGYDEGSADVTVTAGEADRAITVYLVRSANHGADAAPKTKRHSVPMMITGIVIGGAGLVAAVTGVLLMAGANNGALTNCAQNVKCSPAQQRNAGAALAIAGGASVAVGVPLLIVGARTEPSAEPRAAFAAPIGFSFSTSF